MVLSLKLLIEQLKTILCTSEVIADTIWLNFSLVEMNVMEAVVNYIANLPQLTNTT